MAVGRLADFLVLAFDDVPLPGWRGRPARLIGSGPGANAARKPPVADTHYEPHHQQEACNSQENDKTQRQRQGYHHHTDNDHQHVCERIACRKLPVSELLIQDDVSLLFLAGVKTFKPWHPGGAIVVGLLEVLSHTSIRQ